MCMTRDAIYNHINNAFAVHETSQRKIYDIANVNNAVWSALTVTVVCAAEIASD